MDDIDALSNDEISKLTKANLLSLVKADKARRSSEPDVRSTEKVTLDAIERLLDSKLNELTHFFTSRVETIENNVQKLNKEINDMNGKADVLSENLKFTNEEMVDLQKDNKNLKEKCQELRIQVAAHATRLLHLTSDNERYQKNKNRKWVEIVGLKEDPREDLKKKVASLRERGLEIVEGSIEEIYRIGQREGT